MSLNGNENENKQLILNKEQVDELDEEGVEIESLHVKVEELMGLVKTATVHSRFIIINYHNVNHNNVC
jgi:hypothetical protein